MNAILDTTAANTTVLADVAEWLTPSDWDEWPATEVELDAAVVEYCTVGGETDEAMVAAWLPIARELWASIDAPETAEQRARREARERFEDEDDRAYRRLVEVQAGFR